MNFVQQLEECLRDLAAEARKKHPGVKEASERATLRLRTLQSSYVAAVRKASSGGTGHHPTTSMFQSSEILHPFLLAANYPNADYKLLEISFKAMRLLMEADAIVPTDAIHMIRVYQIQGQVITAYFTKYYAKEIAAAAAALDAQQQQYESMAGKKNDCSLDEEDGDGKNTESAALANTASTATTTTSSSWFSWGISHNSGTNSASRQTNSNQQESSSTTSSGITLMKNAVSSSSGQTGHPALASSYPQMEKLALEILSSLLQLVQLLRNYCQTVQPSPLTEEIWTHSVSIACLWYSLLPPHHNKAAAVGGGGSSATTFQGNTVQQASHSTVHQLIILLFQTNIVESQSTAPTSAPNSSGSKGTTSSSSSINHKFIQSTWDDLLALTASDPRCVGGGNNSTVKLNGAFRLCQKRNTAASSSASSSRAITTTTNNTTTALPPSPELALELMTQVWKETKFVVKNSSRDIKGYEEILLRTMGVTMALLQQISKKQQASSVEKALRCIQWTLALIQSQAKQYPNECNELFAFMIHKLIPVATTACRKNHDFEDGYVYNYDNHYSDGIEPSPSSGGIDLNNKETALSRQRSSKGIGSQVLGSCFPISLLWKAGFVLELTYHIFDTEDLNILDNDELALLFLIDGEGRIDRRKGKSILQSLTETLSDFATVGSSCHDHIIQVVFCTRSASSFKPKVFRSAEQIISTGNSEVYFSQSSSGNNTINITNARQHIDNTAISSKSGRITTCPILGESIWIAFQIIIRIGECLSYNRRTIHNPKRLFNEIFPSSLAVLQHFMKRFVACEELIRLALKGYSTLADISFSAIKDKQQQSQEGDDDEGLKVEQRVLLSSLSKLSLPSWGKHDPSSQLRDHHVLSLLSLLRIVHTHYDEIGSEYELIFKTFEELSVLSIASTQLSDEIYHSSLALAASYARFAGLSTCMSSDSLRHMTVALANICEIVLQDRDALGESDALGSSERLPPATSSSSQDGNAYIDPARDSIGGKIMSMGVRAIYGSSDSNVSAERRDELSKAERTKHVYYQDYRNDFLRRISASSTPVRTNSLGRIPFCLILLADVALANVFRQAECGEIIGTQFSKLAASIPIIRPFLMDIVTIQIMAQLSPNEHSLSWSMYKSRGKIVFEDPMHSQLLAIESGSDSVVSRIQNSQVEALRPLCESIKATDKAGVAQSALGVLNSILEGTGETLQGDVWPIIIDAIASLSGGSSSDRASADWATCCLMAFKSLKLIVDDFLDHLPGSTTSQNITTHISLLECCESFVISRHDINTSLTAIGLLWTIADKDSESSSIERALSKLVALSCDDRTEVRNAAVNTLFSCIAGRGSSFTIAFWKICIKDAILKVYDIVTEKSRSGAVPRIDTPKNKPQRYSVSLHHSRDSAGKQWVVTQVLVLRGLTRVLRNFFSQLLDAVAMGQDKSDPDLWFQDAWVKILDYAFDAAGQAGGRENLDIRSVGVELLVACCQLASKAGIQAAISPAKVSTKMEVVNGALRNVRDIQSSKLSRDRTYSGSAADAWREKLFLEAFESLEFFDEEILKTRPDPDDTDLQVLHKFCSNLANLYLCCKDDEFKSDSAARCLQSLDINDDNNGRLRESMEGRFVRLIVSVLTAASTDPKLRYLNQCQRCAVDLLQTMATDGSASAFDSLILLAGLAFFVRKDGEESETGTEVDIGNNAPEYPSLLNFEAALTVSREISKPSVSNECKMFVLYKVLERFLTAFHTDTSKKDHRWRRYYKSFVPVIVSGLQSTAQFEEQEVKSDSNHVVDVVWDKFFLCFKDMLSPVPLGKELLKITRCHELLSIIPFAVSTVPDRHRNTLCSVLAYGASGSFDAAKQHAIHAKFDAFSDMGRKSKRHRDDLLKLFDTCFSGCCSLNPEDPSLRSVACMALKGSLDSSEDSRSKVSIEASLLVCNALRNNKDVDTIIIATFPILCNLIASDDSTNKNSNSKELKDAVQKVFVEAKVGETLDRAKIRYEMAVQRATDAEKRIEQLEEVIRNLQQGK